MKGLAKAKIYNDRFVQAVDAVKKAKRLRFDADICRALGLSPQQFNKIKTGRQIASVDIMDKMTELYGVNPSFLLQGELPLFLPPGNETPEEALRRRVVDLVENDLVEMAGKAAYQLFYDTLDGVSFSTYKEFKHGRIKTISPRFKRFLQRAYGVNPKYIETGEGEKFLPEPETDTQTDSQTFAEFKAETERRLNKLEKEMMAIFQILRVPSN